MGTRAKYSRDASESRLLHVDLESPDEVAMLSYIGKNVIKGTRAQDEYMLDWSSVIFEEADATGKQSAGAKYKNQSTKNNKQQRDRVKAIPCTSACKGAREGCGCMIEACVRLQRSD